MPEPATTSVAEFEEPAVAPAHARGTAPGSAMAAREEPAKRPWLFDIEAFTLHQEAAYSAMYERHQAGLLPEHIEIMRLAAVRRRVRRQRIPLPFKLSGTYDSRAC
jgi:hypothetical protein